MSYPTATECAAILADAAKMRRWMGDVGKDLAAPPTGHSIPAGGTTGQQLTKVSNTDYDVDWEAAGSALTSPLTTKGDLWGFSSVDARLPAGADARLLQADAAQTLGLRYAALSGDATIALGGALTLATVNANVGTFGDAGDVPVLTVNAKGLVTAASTTPATDAYVAASVTGATTVNYATARVHKLTMTGNITITLTATTSGVACGLTIYLVQDGTGSRLVTWPGSVKWPGGVAPTLTTTASATDLVVLETFDGGTSWYANVAGFAYA